MAFELPPLPYALQALEPFISARTLEFHHGKHHQTYVNNLNGLLPGSPFETLSLEEIILKADGPIYNNGAQVWNHTFYFESLSPSAASEPQGSLAEAIKRDFGSYDSFREEFTKSALSLFGSGWAWLVKDDKGRLFIVQESNAGNPLRKGLIPLLTCDVWEHAYYLDYQNRRQEYINAFWKVLDWGKVSSRY
ncbi:MAG TPA: superoxide dismutase [Bacteroidales bacterium]|nr:superoxide dismutase [Bacteroidales bacterium]